MDGTVNRLIHPVSEISRKLNDLKSRSVKTNESNRRGNNQTGPNRIYRQFHDKNDSALPSRGTKGARQGGRTPVYRAHSKSGTLLLQLWEEVPRVEAMSEPLGQILPHMR